VLTDPTLELYHPAASLAVRTRASLRWRWLGKSLSGWSRADPAQRWRILQALAVAEAGSTLSDCWYGTFAANASLILITLTASSSIAAAGRRQRTGGLFTLLVDPLQFGRQFTAVDHSRFNALLAKCITTRLFDRFGSSLFLVRFKSLDRRSRGSAGEQGVKSLPAKRGQLGSVNENLCSAVLVRHENGSLCCFILVFDRRSCWSDMSSSVRIVFFVERPDFWVAHRLGIGADQAACMACRLTTITMGVLYTLLYTAVL
jgi:hypothetical protein